MSGLAWQAMRQELSPSLHASNPYWSLSLSALAAALVGTLSGCEPEPEEQDSGEHSESPRRWSYDGPGGPEYWSELSERFVVCQAGQEQSPIDLAQASSTAMPALAFDYRPATARVVHKNLTLQVDLEPGSSLRIGDEAYTLRQFHFHTPSEHRVAGREYPMELHLVHEGAQGQLAVVGVLIDSGEESAALEPVWALLPERAGEEWPVAGLPFDAVELLPAARAYFRYAGSLTVPPCQEGVRWSVLKQPIQLSREQIGRFKALFRSNARPVQPRHGRGVEG
jgi:carbonic anhydrase